MRKLIRKAGGTAMADGADVANFEQVKAMVERATKERQTKVRAASSSIATLATPASSAPSW